MNEIYYYASLSAAVEDLNAGSFSNALSDSTNAAVKVVEDQGKRCLRLLGAVAEGNDLLVSDDIELVLGGNTLTLTGTACLTFGEGTDCVIDGTVPGSMIRCAERETQSLIVGNGDCLKVYGGRYESNTVCNSSAITMRINTGKAVLEGCTLNHKNTGENGRGVAFFVAAPVRAVLEDCKITAEGTNAAYAVMAAGGLNLKVGSVAASSGTGQSSALLVNTGSKVAVTDTCLCAASGDGDVYTIQNKAEVTIHTGTVAAKSAGALANGYCVGIHNGDGSKLTVTDSVVRSETVNATALSLWNFAEAAVKGGSLTTVSTDGTAEGMRNQSSAYAQLSECAVTAESDQNMAVGLTNYSDAHMDIDSCKISVNTDHQNSKGIINFNILVVADSTVTADAPNESAEGVVNSGCCILLNTDVEGIHSGCQNNGHLYVRGGTFTGWTHGGIYLACGDRPNTEGGETGEGYLNYINDAVLRCGYSGRHAEEIKALGLPFCACGYLGSATQVTGHMDNCVIGGPVMVSFDLEAYRAACEANPELDAPQIVPCAISFRRAYGETNNTLYISNSRVYGSSFRIDNGFDGSDLGHRLYVGGGTNITEASVNNPADTIFTGTESYRQSEAWFRAQVL